MRKENIFRKGHFNLETGVVRGNDFWFFSMDFNALFHVDLSSNKQLFLGSVPNEPLYKKRLFGSMQLINNKLFLIPFSMSRIHSFL